MEQYKPPRESSETAREYLEQRITSRRKWENYIVAVAVSLTLLAIYVWNDVELWWFVVASWVLLTFSKVRTALLR